MRGVLKIWPVGHVYETEIEWFGYSMLAVTGATGFIGRELCSTVAARGRAFRAFARRPGFELAFELTPIGDIAGNVDWKRELEGVQCVMHLAGRAHVLGRDPAAEKAFLRTNVHASVELARAAAASGVRRLVFVSSIGVHGVSSARPFTATDTPAPTENYAESKLRAEESLRCIASETGLELVIVRPPLVYGPSAPGNLGRLVRLVRRGIPLPLSGLGNRRSLVSRTNLVDLLLRCSDHPAAPGQTFLVSDGNDLSTADLIRGLARAMGRPARLFPCPPSLLRMVGQATGRRAEVERLLGSLQVDIRHTCETLDWTPPVSVEEGLRRTVEPILKGST